MKQFIVCAVILAVIPVLVFAQPGEFQLDKIQISSGQGALTSGLDVTSIFSREKNTFEITGNAERVYAVYKWRILPSFNLSASGGFFNNAPWAGSAD